MNDESRADGQRELSEELSRLDTTETGLSQQEAESRLEGHGPNTIQGHKRNPLWKVLGYFNGPIPWMIEAASILAAVAGHWEDFFVILALLFLNVGVSFWHEQKADQAIAALKEKLSSTARVVRDGEVREIEARAVVPGDVVEVRMGDVVPADARLLNGQSLAVDESALTGESLPVEKSAGDDLYSSTSAKRGKARAVVTQTGGGTKFAQTVELVQAAGAESHFRKAVMKIGYFLIGLALVLIIATTAVSIFLRHNGVWEVVLFALGLMLAAIPAALPAVLSVTMSIGASRLAGMKVIVSKLSAMNEMGGAGFAVRGQDRHSHGERVDAR